MERLQTFDEAGAPLTLEARYKVHALGMWHKSAQVYLFNESGELLIQQRSHLKDLWGGFGVIVSESLKPWRIFGRRRYSRPIRRASGD